MAVITRLKTVALILAMVATTMISGLFGLVIYLAEYTGGPSLIDRQVIVFRVDDAFTAKERALILDAFRKVGHASDCVVLKASFETIRSDEILFWRRDGRPTIYKASSPGVWTYNVAKHLTLPHSYVGISFIRTGDIFILNSAEDGDSESESNIEFRNTIVHEALHVVFNSGWHSKDKNSLMYYAIGGKQRLLEVETAKLRAICAN